MADDRKERDKDNVIKLAVDNAQKPKKAEKTPKAKESRARYLIHEGRICKPDGDFPKPLCNFQARIIEQVTRDDGEDSENFFTIEGKLANGRPLSRIEVHASRFAGLGWVPERWGVEAIVYAGSSTKEQLRDALQELSVNEITRRTIFTHTGWRLIDGDWRYLHGGGAIGADGNKQDVEVQPGQGNMERYRLPDPPEGEALVLAIRASLELIGLAPNRPELGAYLLAAIYRAPTAEAAPIDHGGWIHGTTGNFKSEAAALAMAHFGDFNGRTLPANFADSEGSIEFKTHAAKCAFFVLDDFKPVGGANDVNKLHAKADRIFRGVGNQSGRGTLTANRKQRAAYYPRGFVVATGEDLPKGQSLRARLTVIELAKGDIDRERLSECQKAALEGLYRLAMAAYLQWLAPQIANLKTRLPDMIRLIRDDAIGLGFAGAHARTASDYASLRVGLCLLFEFAMQTGALSQAEAAELEERAEKALRELIARQGDNQGEEDEVRRFFALLQSALSAGRCHVSDRLNQGAPAQSPHVWGWRSMAVTTDEGTVEHSKPQGQRIGWTDGKTLWLDGEAAYGMVQVYAREQGGLFEISKTTLWKRVHERGLLTANTYEGGKLRKLAVNVWINGRALPLFSLAANVFEDESLSIT